MMPIERPRIRPKPTTMFGGVAGLDLEEVAPVDDAADHVAHVVALLGLDGHDRGQLGVGVDVVVVGDAGRLLEVVRRQEAEQAAADQDRLVVVLGDEVDDARMRHVGVGAAQGLGGDLLAGHLLDDLGPGDEHLGLAGHDDEVGQRRGVGRPAGAGAADQRDLRHGAGELDVGEEDPAVAGERVDALLHAGPAGVVDEDERAAGLSASSITSATLLAVDLAGRAAQDGEVLAGQVDEAAVDGAAPVTTPSAGTSLPAMPKCVCRCWANRPISSKLPGSTRASMRSRAVSFPPLLLLGQAVGPRPCSSSARRSRSSAVQLLHRRLVLGRSSGWRLPFVGLRRAGRSPCGLVADPDLVGDRAGDRPLAVGGLPAGAVRRACRGGHGPAASLPTFLGPSARVAKNLGATWGNMA